MKKRILVLDNAMDRSAFRPVDAWSRHFGKVPFDTVHLPSGESIPALDRYSHILLTDSEASFRKSEPWFAAEADVVRQAVELDRSVLGSSFGHQMLAWALSGSTYVRHSRIPELGWVAIDIVRTDPLFAALPNPWHAFTSHKDEVVLPPDPWRILASNSACAVQVMRYGNCPVWGIQSNPEIPPDEAKSQMESGLEQYPRYAQQIRQTIIDSPVRDDGAAPHLVQAFLKSNHL
ncbi:type 1 glutamine amidotransferase [Candidatus Bipolaricaulota bacterium]|nr:type 1 glutamine amidotransferase [Candidatus Bipolaricaulota bacterium]